MTVHETRNTCIFRHSPGDVLGASLVEAGDMWISAVYICLLLFSTATVCKILPVVKSKVRFSS